MDTLPVDAELKRQLRVQARSLLRSLSRIQIGNASSRIRQHLLEHLRALTPPPSALLGFRPLANEPNLLPFYEELGKLYPTLPLGFPRVQGLELCFHFLEPTREQRVAGAERTPPPSTPWTTGSFGIQEPADYLPRFDKDIPYGETPLVLVPGLAFDRTGGRLGRGKGYYDRFLGFLRSLAPGTVAIGICFSMQLVPSVPQSASDQKVDFIITEEGLT